MERVPTPLDPLTGKNAKIDAINRAVESERRRRGARNCSSVAAIDPSPAATRAKLGADREFRGSFTAGGGNYRFGAGDHPPPEPPVTTEEGVPRERLPLLDLYKETARPHTGPYCQPQKDAWYWEVPPQHGPYTFSSPRSEYHLTSSLDYAYGEGCYGRRYAMGYPYSQWRQFPYSETVAGDNLPSGYPKNYQAYPKTVSRTIKVNQAASEQWLDIEQELAAGVKERRDRSIWLQAGYGEGRDPVTSIAYIDQLNDDRMHVSPHH